MTTTTKTHSRDVAANSMEVLSMSGSSSTLAMRIARRNGTLRLEAREGRFGAFVAICDDCGTIEVAETIEEAQQAVASA